MTEDPRHRAMRLRFATFSAEQIQAIVDNIDRVVFDEFNYHGGKFCPVAVAVGCMALPNPTQEAVKAEIEKHFSVCNILKGLPGKFYHGTPEERKADLLSLCREFII